MMSMDNRRFMLRMEDDLAARLSTAAAAERRTVAAVIRYAVHLYLAEHYPEEVTSQERENTRRRVSRRIISASATTEK
jgi:hypothetical protein